jgi:hypothetical protein
MNSVMAMKKIPLMIRVMNSVVSIDPQLEAAGVACQGASTWNSTDPITMSTRTIAIAISLHPIPVAHWLCASIATDVQAGQTSTTHPGGKVS